MPWWPFGERDDLLREHRRLTPRPTRGVWKLIGRPALTVAVCLAVGLGVGATVGQFVARNTTVIGFDGRFVAPVRPADEVRWSSEPQVVDPQAAAMPRVEAREAADDGPGGEIIVFSERPEFLDSVTFAVSGGVRMRFAGVEGIAFNAICTGPDGARWACGNRARGAIRELLGGNALVCRRRDPAPDGAVLVTCLLDGRDFAATLVGRGFARRIAGAGG